MSANRANFRCFGADYDVAAVSAFPYFYFALFENGCCFYILKKGSVAFFVAFFDLANGAEFGSKGCESFFFCCFGKIFCKNFLP